MNLEKLIQNNSPQFKTKLTSAIMNELNNTHKFGYKNNLNSQAYIESFHAQTQREFVESIEFESIEDVYRYYERELKNNSRKLDNYLVRVKK